VCVCVEQMEKEENAKKTLGQPEAFTSSLPFHSSYLFYQLSFFFLFLNAFSCIGIATVSYGSPTRGLPGCIMRPAATYVNYV
jgi:maltodextrin utilization protein YvdJ